MERIAYPVAGKLEEPAWTETAFTRANGASLFSVGGIIKALELATHTMVTEAYGREAHVISHATQIKALPHERLEYNHSCRSLLTFEIGETG